MCTSHLCLQPVTRWCFRSRAVQYLVFLYIVALYSLAVAVCLFQVGTLTDRNYCLLSAFLPRILVFHSLNSPKASLFVYHVPYLALHPSDRPIHKFRHLNSPETAKGPSLLCNSINTSTGPFSIWSVRGRCCHAFFSAFVPSLFRDAVSHSSQLDS